MHKSPLCLSLGWSYIGYKVPLSNVLAQIITETAPLIFLIFTGLLSADRRFPYIPDNECIRTSIGFINQ